MKKLIVLVWIFIALNVHAEEQKRHFGFSQQFVQYDAYGGRQDKVNTIKKGSELTLSYSLTEHLRIKAAYVDFGESYLFTHSHIELGEYDIYLNNRSKKIILEATSGLINENWRFSAGLGIARGELDSSISIRSQEFSLANSKDRSLLMTLGAAYQFSKNWSFVMSLQHSSFDVEEALLGGDTGILFADGSGHNEIKLELTELGFGFEYSL